MWVKGIQTCLKGLNCKAVCGDYFYVVRVFLLLLRWVLVCRFLILQTSVGRYYGDQGLWKMQIGPELCWARAMESSNMQLHSKLRRHAVCSLFFWNPDSSTKHLVHLFVWCWELLLGIICVLIIWYGVILAFWCYYKLKRVSEKGCRIGGDMCCNMGSQYAETAQIICLLIIWYGVILAIWCYYKLKRVLDKGCRLAGILWKNLYTHKTEAVQYCLISRPGVAQKCAISILKQINLPKMDISSQFFKVLSFSWRYVDLNFQKYAGGLLGVLSDDKDEGWYVIRMVSCLRCLVIQSVKQKFGELRGCILFCGAEWLLPCCNKSAEPGRVRIVDSVLVAESESRSEKNSKFRVVLLAAWSVIPGIQMLVESLIC